MTQRVTPQSNDAELNPFAQILTDSVLNTESVDEPEVNEPEVVEHEEEEYEVVEVEEDEIEDEESEEEDEEVAEPEPEEPSDDLDEEEEVFPENLTELADAFETDLEKIKSIKVAKKRDGSDVTLEQVIQNWQVSEAVNRKSQELSHLKQSLEAREQAMVTEMGQKLEEQSAIIEALEDLYSYNDDAEMNELRQTDPAEWAARRADAEERKRNLSTIKDTILSERQALSQQEAQQYAVRQQHRLAEEQQILLQKEPRYKDSTVFEQESKDVVQFLVKEGYTPEELQHVVDHRVLLIARDAMRYRNMDQTAKPKIKKVVQKPKRIRSSAPAKKQTTKEKNLNKTIATAAKSKDSRVKQAAIAELLRSM